MAIKEFLDRTGFSSPKEVLDLYGNYIRSGFKFNAYGDQTDFDAIVLSAPIFLLDADLSTRRVAAGSEGGKMDKFAFKARIISSPSPHDYLPDPCDTDISENTIKAVRIINLHTTFFSRDDYTKSSNMIPKVGDVIRVRLKKNIFSFNLQFGEFLSLKTYSTQNSPAAIGECKSSMTSFYAGSPLIPGIMPRTAEEDPATTAARNAIMDLFWTKVKEHDPACKAVQDSNITSRGRTIAYGNRMIMCWGDKTACKNPLIPNNGNFSDSVEVERVRQALKDKGYKIASPASSNHCVGVGCKGGGGKPIIAFDVGCGKKCHKGPDIAKCLKAFRDDTGPKGQNALIRSGVLTYKFCLDCKFTSLTHCTGCPPSKTPPNAGEGGWNQETANGAVHIEIVPV